MTIREARLEDAPAMARVRVDTWRTAYRGIVPDDVLNAMAYEETEHKLHKILWEGESASRAFVAVNAEGLVVGIAISGPVRAEQEDEYREEEYKGEIYALYVYQLFQRQGFGRELVKASMASLLQRGLAPIMLWTFEQNHPARKFYGGLGGTVVRRKNVKEGDKVLVEVGYGFKSGI